MNFSHPFLCFLFCDIKVFMRSTFLVNFFLVLGLSACAQPIMVASDPSEPEPNSINQALGEKCENAKYQLEKTVEEGQLTGLEHFKRNIELHCVWRRN
jgi:hypothetical protein